MVAKLIKQGNKEVENDPVAQMDMQMMYYLKMSRAELNAMSLVEWTRTWCHLKHVRDEESGEKPK